MPIVTGVMLRILVAVVLLPVIVACGGGNTAGNEWDQPWVDTRGERVPELVVSTYRGAEHCDWQSAVFLHLGWPLGTKEKIGPGRQYMRDPKGLFSSEDVVVPLDLDSELPGDARDSGYHLGEVQLWVSMSQADEGVYMVEGDQVERWPRTTEVIACA